jgi:membrane-associated protease RseP (regulator of RpoE activity)
LTERYPAFAQTRRAQTPCYHCHYVHDAQIASERSKPGWNKTLLYFYPPAQTIGLTLSGDSNIVESIAKGSPAHRAKILPGDQIRQADETTVYSLADLQAALNTVPDTNKKSEVTIRLVRAGKPLAPVTLKLPAGWKKYDLSWRASQGAIGPILGFWEEPLTGEERAKLKIAPDRLALRVSVLFAGDKWEPSRRGVQIDDIVTGLNGKALLTMSPRQFHSHVRMHYNVGETIPLDVLRDGKPIRVNVPAVEIGLE